MQRLYVLRAYDQVGLINLITNSPARIFLRIFFPRLHYARFTHWRMTYADRIHVKFNE